MFFSNFVQNISALFLIFMEMDLLLFWKIVDPICFFFNGNYVVVALNKRFGNLNEVQR